MSCDLQPLNEELVSDELVTCAHCEGMFLPQDMDWEHCRDCAEELR